MRIIGGDLGGRKIHPPAKMPFTRPTTDIAKEGLFNILANNLDFSSLRTLDLFGGTGSISYELASRGVKSLVVVEKDPAMFNFIRKNADALGIKNIEVIRMDVFAYMAQSGEKFDLIFAGPPYALTNIEDIPRKIFEHQLLNPKGWHVLEHTPRNEFSAVPHFVTSRNYGTTVFSIFINRGEGLR